MGLEVTMSNQRNLEELERWRAQEKLLNSEDRGANHPVHVKVRETEEQEDLVAAKGCSKTLKTVLIVISTIVTILVVTACIAVGVYALLGTTSSYPTDPRNETESLTEHSQEIIFQYLTLDSETVNYNLVIKDELKLYFHQIRSEEKPSYLKRFFKYHHELLSHCNTDEQWLNYLDKIDSNRLNFYKLKMRETKDLLIQIGEFEEIFKLVEDLNGWYGYLDELKQRMMEYEFQTVRTLSKPVDNCEQLLAFVRKTNELRTMRCSSMEIEELQSLRAEYTSKLNVSVESSVIELTNNIVIMSEVVAVVAGQGVPIKSVYVFASERLYWDTDVELPGAKLVVIAPEWSLTGTIKVDLRGKDGVRIAMATARVGERGKPGNPGGNGGNFLGIGNFSPETIEVLTHGGNGGDAQNGADGEDGTNGGFPDKEVNDPKCMMLEKQYKNTASEVIRYYKIFDSRGCGGSGMAGGVAGPAGLGGSGYLMPLNGSPLLIVHGKDGKQGGIGRGGRAGAGGKNGCYYKAYTLNRERWTRFTSTTCRNDTMPRGEPGKDGANSAGLDTTPQDTSPVIFSQALLRFRRFARLRYKLGDNILDFIQHIDKEMLTFNVTEQLSLVEEYKAMDQEDACLALFQSLAARCEQYMTMSKDEDYSVILRAVHTAALSKTTQLKYGSESCLVADLETYLQLILDSVDEIDEMTLTRVDNSGVVAKETLTRQVNDMDITLQDHLDELYLRYLHLAEEIKSKLDDKEIFAKSDQQQKMFYLQLASNLDARGVVELLIFVGRSLNHIMSITNRTLHDEEISEELKVLKQLVLDREGQQSWNLARALNVTKISALSFNEAMLHVKNSIETNINNTAYLKQMNVLNLVRVLPNFKEYTGNEEMLERSVAFSSIATDDFNRLESNLVTKLKQLPGDSQRQLLELLDVSQALASTVVELTRYDSEDIDNHLVDQLIQFMEILRPIDAYVQDAQLTTSLHLIDHATQLKNASSYNAVLQLKHYIYNNMIRAQYVKAVQAFKQWVFPYGEVYTDLDSESVLDMKGTKQKVQALMTKVKEYKSTVASFDKNVRVAAFVANSSANEFYKWHNKDVGEQLEQLFQGKKINLRADVENIHVLNKSAVKFRTIRLEFVPKRGSKVTNIEQIFKDFALEMKHPGFSYYNYQGKTYLITTDSTVLWYSYKQDISGQPESYNHVYQKLKNGDIILSPFTTWTVQLQQINFAARYENLESLAKELDVLLVGYGSYVVESNSADVYYPRLESYTPVRRRFYPF